MTCEKCGTINGEGTVFCVKCGTKLRKTEVPTAPVSEAAPPPAAVAEPWYQSAKGILNWCLGRDGDVGPGFVETTERDERGRIQFECVACQTILPPKMPDSCPKCGREFAVAASGPRKSRLAATPPASTIDMPVAASPSEPTPPAPAATQPVAPTTPHDDGIPAGVREILDPGGAVSLECAHCGFPVEGPNFPERCSNCGWRLDGEGPTKRRRFRVRWTHAAAAAVTIVGVFLIASFAMGLPLRATKAAFAELRVADDQGGVGTMRPELVVDACPDDSTATKERLKQLSRVLWDLNTENQAGGWVASGRLLKYASALGTPRTETQAALASLRQRMNTDGELTEKTERAMKALQTIGKRYSTWPLRQRAVEALAGDLGIQADEGKLWAEVESRHAQIVAQEEADKAARIAAERQARQAEAAARRPRFYIFEGRAYYPGQDAQLQAAMAESNRFRQQVERNHANERRSSGGGPWVGVPGGGETGGQAASQGDALAAQAEKAEKDAASYAYLHNSNQGYINAAGIWAEAGEAYRREGRTSDMLRAQDGMLRCLDRSNKPTLSNEEAAGALGL